MNDFERVLLIVCVILGAALIAISYNITSKGSHTNKQVVEYGCGEFDTKTGEFKLR